MISIIPFRARHLIEIKPDIDADTIGTYMRAQYEGVSYTAFLGGKAIGAAGVWVQKPGIGEAWAIFAPAMKAFPLLLHREVKSRLNKVMKSLDEVYIICAGDDKWFVKLGFSFVSRETVAMKHPEALAVIEPGQEFYVRYKCHR
jgi:hypothetical protein